MKKNKLLAVILIFVLTFTTLFSFSVSYAMTEEEYQQIRETFKQTNPFEMTISEMCLAVGDFAMEYLTFLLKEEVTIQKILFNRVDTLNANFFENSVNASTTSATDFIRVAVNEWYDFLGKLVIIIYMIALVVVGVKILLDGPSGKVKARDIMLKWTMGVAIFYFFPFVMRYAYDLNEAFISIIRSVYDSGQMVSIESYVGMLSDLRADEIEERSPEYVTRTSYVLTLGSEDATVAYINRLEDYKAKGDLMRIMRALAGISGRMIYVILWYIMLFQLVIFIFIYFKRYLMLAFLIAVFPITLIEYIIGTIVSGKQSGLSAWCKEFFVNVFIQSIHAAIYGIITGVVVNQIYYALQQGSDFNMNWLLMICAINFVFTAERAFKEIINAMATETIKSADDVAKDAGNLGKKAKGKAKSVASMMHK